MLLFRLSILVLNVFIVGARGPPTRHVKGRKSQLDIVLAFDQSASLREGSDWKLVYPDIKKCAEYFYRDTSKSCETQMAVIGKHESTPPLFFTKNKEAIFAKIDTMMDTSAGNYHFAEAAKIIKTQVFNTSNNARPGVDNIAFYITDCNANNEDRSAVMLHDACKLFMFICMKTSPTGYDHSPPLMKELVRNDMSKIYNYKDYPSFQEYMDKLLERHGLTEDIPVWDCEFDSMIDGPCQLTGGQCLSTRSPHITQHPDPVHYAKPCPAIETKPCNMDQCVTPTPPPITRPPPPPITRPPPPPPVTTGPPPLTTTILRTTTGGTTEDGNGGTRDGSCGTGGDGSVTGYGNGTGGGNGTGSGNGTGNGNGASIPNEQRAGDGATTEGSNMTAIIIGVAIGVIFLCAICGLGLWWLSRHAANAGPANAGPAPVKASAGGAGGHPAPQPPPHAQKPIPAPVPLQVQHEVKDIPTKKTTKNAKLVKKEMRGGDNN